MQPLSYQSLPTSCWITSMINGMLFLLKDNKKISLLAYRLLHELLVDEGVFCYTQKELKNFKIIICAVEACSGIQIRFFRQTEVETELENLHFRNQVAVCDIGAGEHSILITKLNNSWFEGFDPWWDSVKGNPFDKEKYKTYAPFKEGTQGTVNVRIQKDHLLKSRNIKPYQMGSIKYRFMTVLTKKST